MKRIFCVLLAVLLAAAFSFGQELKFDGYVNSGLGLLYTDAEDANGDKQDPTLMGYGVDSERNIGRFRLNGAYTNADKNAGLNFRFQVQGRGSFSTTSSSAATGNPTVPSGGTAVDPHTHTVTATTRYPINAPSLAFGYGWVKPVEMLTIKAGLVDDSTWRTADYIYNESQSEGAGLLLRLSPISGLDIGAGAYVATFNSGSNNNFFGVNVPEQIKLDEAKYTINAAYTMDKVFRFMVSWRNENETGGNAADYGNSQILAELRLLMVENLTAIVVGRYDNLDNDDKDKNLIFYETFGYKIGDLGLGLNAAEFVKMDTAAANANDDFSFWVNPWVSYSMAEGKIVPRLDVVYFMGGLPNGTNYHRRAFAANYNTDASVINARPSIKFNLDSRASLEIGDSFYYVTPGKDIDAVINNVFYTDIVVRF